MKRNRYKVTAIGMLLLTLLLLVAFGRIGEAIGLMVGTIIVAKVFGTNGKKQETRITKVELIEEPEQRLIAKEEHTIIKRTRNIYQ